MRKDRAEEQLPLRNLLEDRSYRIGLRIMSLEYYIASLQGLHDDLAILFGQNEGEVCFCGWSCDL